MAIGPLRQAALDAATSAKTQAGKVKDLADQLANASSEDAPKLMALLNQASSELNQIMDALKKIYETDQRLSRAPQ